MDDETRRAADPGAVSERSPGRTDSATVVANSSSRYLRWLATAAIFYALVHHLGLLPAGLGAAPVGTQIVDWLDLLVPYVVLVPVAATLRAAPAGPRTRTAAAVGAVMYTSGHGIHLAGNSVGNVDPGPTAHLWDEIVGHYLWYSGVLVIAAALAATMVGRPRPPHLGHYLFALAAGTTWGTNAIGGGTVPLGLAAAVVAVFVGWRHRRGLPVVLAATGLPASTILATHLVIELIG